MKPRILYAGDNRLDGAAAYLGGILEHHKLEFDYVPSDRPLGDQLAAARHTLYIISDYPVKNFGRDDFDRLVERVHDGSGLLMIGGWESFHGAAGEYAATALSEALPVEMQTADDRVNLPQPCLIEKLCDHPILAGLPMDRPPGVGGFNRVRARTEATAVLGARQFAVRVVRRGADDVAEYEFAKGALSPLLVVGTFGEGRTAAFTSDVAPHWVGGFVDWGDRRITARAPGGGEVEVGNWYARFFANLVLWTARDL